MFIKNIDILHKDFVEETKTKYRTVNVKKIEFVRNHEITKKQFEWFIRYLKFIGFNACSDRNTIKFTENGKIVFNYNFNKIVTQNVNDRGVKLTSKYKTQHVA